MDIVDLLSSARCKKSGLTAKAAENTLGQRMLGDGKASSEE
ncbi:MAG TPA: hypothetical protein VF534_38225 [Paraburkholderia sp.]